MKFGKMMVDGNAIRKANKDASKFGFTDRNVNKKIAVNIFEYFNGSVFISILTVLMIE